MPRIFISYRRDDSQGISGRIYDRLADAFSEEDIFMDVDDIPPGVDFREHLQSAIAAADVVLLIIGSRWAGLMRKRRRDAHDFVRVEMMAALEQQKVTIPVLIGNTEMPPGNSLPPRAQAVFPFLNAVQVEHGANFHRDMDRLIEKLRHWEALPEPPSLPEVVPVPEWMQSARRIIILMVIVTLGILLGALVDRQRNLMESANPNLTIIERAPTSDDISAYMESPRSDTPIVGEVNLLDGNLLALRPEPDHGDNHLTTIEPETLLVIEARNWSGKWLWTSYEGQSGWVAAEFMRIMRDGQAIDVLDVPLYGGDLGTVMGLVSGYEDANRIEQTVKAIGRDELLDNDEFTLLLVSDNALDALLITRGVTFSQLLGDTEFLTALLDDHMINGTWTLDALAVSEAQTIAGTPINVTYAPDGQRLINGVPVRFADIRASNGIIHVMADMLAMPDETD